jgi:hypothetical protein
MGVHIGEIMLVAWRLLSPGFLELYWSAAALASNWLEDYANCTPTPEENGKYSAYHS